MCSAEIRIASMYRAGILGVLHKEFLQPFFMVLEEFVLQACHSFGVVLVDLHHLIFIVEKVGPIITVDLFGHIKRGTVTGCAELCHNSEGPCIVFFSCMCERQCPSDDQCRCDCFLHRFLSSLFGNNTINLCIVCVVTHRQTPRVNLL